MIYKNANNPGFIKVRLLPLRVVVDDAFGQPVGQGLAVRFENALLVAKITDVAQLNENRNGIGLAQHIEIAVTYCA